MILPSQAARVLSFALLLVTVPTVEPSTAGTPADEAPVGPTLVRELVRLDEELDLGTYPDGSGLWTARFAAALEHRLGAPDSGPAPAPHLMRHLAVQLRHLGVERDLEPVPGAPAAPATAERRERLDRLLTTVRLLRGKLERLARGDAEGHRVQARTVPGNDLCTSAFPLTGLFTTGSTAGASNDATASCGSSDSSPDVWFSYAATQDGSVTFHTLGSSFDTVLSLWDRCPGADGRGVELACNDDAAGTDQSRLTLEMTAGQEVRIRVAGFNGDAGDFELTVGPARGITGTVTRSDTGAPLAGVEVGLYSSAGLFRQSIFTDGDGHYLFSPLSVASYLVRTLNAPGLVDEMYDDVPCFPFTACTPSGTLIQVRDGLTTGIDLALDEAGGISGTVTDAGTGDPLEAHVALHADDGAFLTSVQSGADGGYEFPTVPAGQYELRAQASGYQSEVYDDLPCAPLCPLGDGTSVTVSPGATTGGVDFALDELGGIAGVVTEDPSGLLLEFQRVDLYDQSGNFLESRFTSTSGTYSFDELTPATHFVRTQSSSHRDEVYDDVPCLGDCDVTTGTPVTVSFGGTTTGIDFSLLTFGTITGTVVQALTGLPLNNAEVRAISAGDNPSGFDRSSPDGTYVIDDLIPGDYYVRASASLHVDELYDDVSCLVSCPPTSGTAVPVDFGTTTAGVDLALDRLGVIEGTVVGADTGTTLSGAVSAFDESGALVAQDDSFQGYVLQGLPPGDYHVKASVSDFAGDYQDELFDDVPCEPTCDVSAGTVIPIGLNTTAVGIDFALRPCPGDTNVDVFSTLYFATHTTQACERLTAGGTTTVQPGADVTFEAGRTIVLSDGFSVQSGGSFRAVLVPEWTRD